MYNDLYRLIIHLIMHTNVLHLTRRPSCQRDEKIINQTLVLRRRLDDVTTRRMNLFIITQPLTQLLAAGMRICNLAAMARHPKHWEN